MGRGKIMGIEINLEHLPSKGKGYPEGIQVFVEPLKVKKQIEMERYGVTPAEYFNIVLQGVEVIGMSKDDLWFFDVNMIDLIRRILTMDVEDSIHVSDLSCYNCGNPIEASFKFGELNFTDFNEDIINKEFTFNDGTTFVVSPITIRSFLDFARKNKKVIPEELYYDYIVSCVKEVKEQEFETSKNLHNFVREYVEEIFLYKDRKILEEIELGTASKLQPLVIECPMCGKENEVEIIATTRFHQ